MERTKIKNPQTGRWIFKDGPTADALRKEGVRLRGGPTKKGKTFVPPPPGSYDVTSSFHHYPVDTSAVSWTEKQPSRTSERRRLLETCGKSCFMMPQELKFPVCNKKAPPCTYNQRGITAAYVRARQFKYQDVANNVEALRQKLGLKTAVSKR